jgi:hypothetical protein
VSGIRFRVPGSQDPSPFYPAYPVCGFFKDRCQVPGTRYRVPATWHLGPGTRHRSRIDTEGRTPSTEDRARPPENAHTGTYVSGPRTPGHDGIGAACRGAPDRRARGPCLRTPCPPCRPASASSFSSSRGAQSGRLPSSPAGWRPRRHSEGPPGSPSSGPRHRPS